MNAKYLSRGYHDARYLAAARAPRFAKPSAAEAKLRWPDRKMIDHEKRDARIILEQRLTDGLRIGATT